MRSKSGRTIILPVTAERRRSLLPRGRVLLRALRSDPTQEYLVLLPNSAAANAPILVFIHGASRNAYEQATLFAAGCEKRGIVLVAPIFTQEQNRGYQRLGSPSRTDLVLNRCLAEAALLSGMDVSQFHLFGSSGGAQFAHRYMMAYPERVAHAILVAAGWYTFPDHTQRFPYGIRPGRTQPCVNFNPERFLQVPVDVFVGAKDLGSSNLRATERVNKQQGVNRVERARNWVAAMEVAARMYGLPPRINLTVVPEVNHSLKQFCREGGLVERVLASIRGSVTKVRDEIPVAASSATGPRA